jgi:hypothetical protein
MFILGTATELEILLNDGQIETRSSTSLQLNQNQRVSPHRNTLLTYLVSPSPYLLSGSMHAA